MQLYPSLYREHTDCCAIPKAVANLYWHAWSDAHTYASSFTNITPWTIPRSFTIHQWIPPRIRAQLQRNTFPVHRCTIQWPRCPIRVTITHVASQKQRNAILHYILTVLHLLLHPQQQQRPPPCFPSSIHFQLFLTNAKKRASDYTTQSLGREEINTAFTTACPDRYKGELVLFRKEEWQKVLLHECFHLFGFDRTRDESKWKEVHVLLKKHVYPKSGLEDFGAYEAYTEWWAEVLYTSYRAFLATNNRTTFWKEWSLYLRIEMLFVLVQIRRILQHSGVDALSTDPFPQSTHVFAYFVLRGQLLLNTRAFWIWTNGQWALSSGWTPQTLVRFWENHPLPMRTITQIELPSHGPLHNTFRMTIT